jgi:molybdopterin molybdotransferase
MKFSQKKEKIPLDQALGRVLPMAMSSPIDHPPFDKSAMDGFAYGKTSPNGIYRVMEEIAAGEWSERPLGEGDAARIMTGAPLPPGATGVQRIEWTRSLERDREGLMLVAFTKPESATNIIRKGENLKAGMEILGPRVLAPQDIGILAAAGIAEMEVLVRPKIGIISTGNEITPPGSYLPAASIYDSNGPQLKAQAEASGAQARFYGIARDEKEALKHTLALALEANDVVVVSGGVSMGDFDLVPSMLSSLEVEPLFHSIAMRPGKPTFFGRREETVVFGLPGNPVSTFVNFEILVKAYLWALQGIPRKPPTMRVRLGKSLARKGSDRVEFLPATLRLGEDGMVATPLQYHGSSMITVLADTDAFLRMEIGQEKIEEGAFIDARLVRP